MKKEQDLIPYECASLPDGPYLVCAPHPDDETFGMGGTIAAAADSEIEVYVLFLTDGSQGGDSLIRKEEARRACELLGVKKTYFWDIPDRQLAHHRESLENRFRALVNSIQPGTVFAPSVLEFHPDHRATAFLAWNSLRRLKYSGQFWMYEVGRQGEANRLIDISSYMARKIEAIEIYSSQLRSRHYKDVVVAINRARSFTLEGVDYAEAFFAVEEGEDLVATLRRFQDGYFEGFSRSIKMHRRLLAPLAGWARSLFGQR